MKTLHIVKKKLKGVNTLKATIKGYTRKSFNFVCYPIEKTISIPHIIIHPHNNKGWDSATKITIILELKDKEIKNASIK